MTAVVRLDDPYVDTLVREALAAQCPSLAIVSEWPPQDHDGDAPPLLQWREYEQVDWDMVSRHPECSLANTYCIRKALIRKIQMANAFQYYCAKRPGCTLARHVPETWIFRLDHPSYLDEALNECWEVERGFRNNLACDDPRERERFIMKPSMTGRGAGIYLLESLADMEQVLEALFEDSDDDDEDDDDDDDDGEQGSAWMLREWVIQRYIGRPLLLANDPRKFHIRAYVLSVGRMHVYLYREMLALFAGADYDAADIAALDRHLTNTCLQQHARDFDESRAVRAFWDLASHGLDRPALDGIFDQCARILGDCFAAVTSDAVGFQALPNAFELYGFDFLVDDARHVWLLEANAFPDFAQTGEQLRGLVRGLFEATVGVAVCPFVAAVEHGTPPPSTPPSDPRLRLVYDRSTSHT
ncbi:tubulin-tyrosine ligase family-domain-containing protein [Syncephalis pseudoplumigaleata]|uniref:Tubulin-tyrosine ligase family-domain-containing protein n=1 Tax=Syncephalis pseudoplumigaleata TaxID=1712513 RepID=A0A4P9Z3A6_9FUNG|nr:tubulin-tyrosine ligase family-domain-containing protein [Syncephalis pseudoplumigaleata]|eukprot:RKP26936.1 tubulin-tyrosine ligase family-domain-containing protein [Syncephalis pseudoplumigaleata]